ncbi:MAG: M20 aminoacylase family protein [Enterobacteriaceae bacterium]
MVQKNVVAEVQEITPGMVELRHAIHAHPELGFEEFNTHKLVVEKLREWGYEIHTGLGGTGVVATLRNGEGKTIGVRADMDALPIHEATTVAWKSQIAGKMHACGHDGHTATLLAAAYALAQRRQFKGTVHLLFQPAEEGPQSGSGAKKMLDEGLFKLFPCDAIFALHNMPGYPVGKIGMMEGPFMASSDEVIIRIYGQGGHGAMPNKSIDPVVVSASLVMALQTVVSRNVPPLETAVVSVGALLAGEACNVIPDSAEMRLSVRCLSPEVRDLLQKRITDLAHSQAASFGARAEVDYRRGYPVLVNDPTCTEFVRQVALEMVGAEGMVTDLTKLTGSEDFAYWLEQCPGCYLIVGNGDGEGSCMVHNPGYDFNDEIIPTGASLGVKLVERYLAA